MKNEILQLFFPLKKSVQKSWEFHFTKLDKDFLVTRYDFKLRYFPKNELLHMNTTFHLTWPFTQVLLKRFVYKL